MSCGLPNEHCDALLLEYAAGTLDDAHHLLITAYLTLSPAGRRYVTECERLGGALIEQLCDPVAVSGDCLDSLMAKIDCGTGLCEEPAPACPQTCLECREPLPAPLARLFPAGAPETAQWRNLTTGMQIIDIALRDCPSCLRLVRCEPGAVIPLHGHQSLEITLVLEGSILDHTGRYRRGDLILLGPAAGSQPVADAQAGCLCMVVLA